jgi:PPOX class probable F420-dependent enzyme
MVDLTSNFGREVQRQLANQFVIWLTTVDSNLSPQPRPVWFIWENDSFLVFSQEKAHKVKHILKNPNVAMHFNTDETGDKQVIIFIGEASIDKTSPPAHKVPAYLNKYEEAIAGLEMTPEEFSREYSIAIKIKPAEVRGWE